MDTEEIISTLKLFIEKADKLNNGKFVRRIVNDSGVVFSMGVGKPTIAKRRGPDDENIEAFVLTFRFFIQDNESISLRRAKNIFHSDVASEEEKNSFVEARNHLNAYLDGDTMINVKGIIKRRELMDVFIYGGLSHANDKKKKKYDEWMGNELLIPFLQNEFSVILYDVLNVILFVKDLCERVLKRVDGKT